MRILEKMEEKGKTGYVKRIKEIFSYLQEVAIKIEELDELI